MVHSVKPGMLKQALGTEDSPEDSISGLTPLVRGVSLAVLSTETSDSGLQAPESPPPIGGALTPPKEKYAAQQAFQGVTTPLDHSQFKDVNGRYRTVSLFYEMNTDKKYPSFFTLKDRDTNGYTSMRKMYMDEQDIPEYRFAQKALGSWDHWQKLCNNYWFKDVVSEWRKELQLKLSSEQLQHMKQLATRNDAIGLSAARAILSAVSPNKGRGRPSKEEVLKERNRIMAEEQTTTDDAKRLGVVVDFVPKDTTING